MSEEENMKKYNKKERVPMTFHYVFRFFILPVAVVANVLMAAVTSTMMGPFVHVAFVLLTAVNVALAVALFVGLGRFSPMAYYLAISFGALMMLEGGISAVATLSTGLWQGGVVASLIAMVGAFETFYYYQRADLFDGKGPDNRRKKDQDNGESIPVEMYKVG